jgi:hypothetical protein
MIAQAACDERFSGRAAAVQRECDILSFEQVEYDRVLKA